MENREHILPSQKALDEFEIIKPWESFAKYISHQLFMLNEFYQDRLGR